VAEALSESAKLQRLINRRLDDREWKNTKRDKVLSYPEGSIYVWAIR
jgi:hypothetical protein